MVCDQVDKEGPLYGCQAELRQEGILGSGVRGCCAHVSSGLGGGIDCPELQSSVRGPPQPSPEALALCSLQASWPTVKVCKLFTRAQLSLVPPRGRKSAIPTVGNSILPGETVGNHGPRC